MNKRLLALALLLTPSFVGAVGSAGERLAYKWGCVHCHHQASKEAFTAPPLLVVKDYTFNQFRHLMRTGITRTGRDLMTQSNVVIIAFKGQFSLMSDAELKHVYTFLSKHWSAERAEAEEAKIPGPYEADSPPPETKK